MQNLFLKEITDYSYCQNFWLKFANQNEYEKKYLQTKKNINLKRQNMLLKILGFLFIILAIVSWVFRR
jgi:hypothetical protein